MIDPEVPRTTNHHLFVKWCKLDELEKYEFGIRLQDFKECLGLPVTSVEEYDEEQIEELDRCYRRYDAYRKIGFNHNQSLSHL